MHDEAVRDVHVDDQEGRMVDDCVDAIMTISTASTGSPSGPARCIIAM